MKKGKDMSCVLLTLLQMGYLDSDGTPSGCLADALDDILEVR